MKNAFEIFETEEDLEVNGVWQDFGPMRALLARSGGKSTLYAKTLTKEVNKLGKATYSAVSEEEGEIILTKVFASTIIKDHEVRDDNDKWKKGVHIKEEGLVKIVPFNLKNMQICLKQLPEYFKALQRYSDDFTTYQKEVEKEGVKK